MIKLSLPVTKLCRNLLHLFYYKSLKELYKLFGMEGWRATTTVSVWRESIFLPRLNFKCIRELNQCNVFTTTFISLIDHNNLLFR